MDLARNRFILGLCRLDVVKEVDPELRRTIMVASKFDNRMREFHARSEVDAYLSARGYLPPHVHPFFVALPQDRSALPTEEFREQVREVLHG